MLEGRLLEYWPAKRLVAFESGTCGAPRVIIMLGGLTDGLLPTPYTRLLDEAAKETGLALVQPVLRTSYSQFGTGTLQHDLDDLCHLVTTLIEDPERARHGPLEVAFVGHSTGCQMICTFTRDAPEALRKAVKAVALQAPVSDREGLTMEMDPQRLRKLCEDAQQAMAEGNPKKIVTTLWGRAPMMARRCVDLFIKGGADDFFSSDFTDNELAQKLGHLAPFKTLLAISLDDEFVPDDTYPGLGVRLQAAIPGSELLVIEDADHALSRPAGAGPQFVEAVMSLINEAFTEGGSSGGDGGDGPSKKVNQSGSESSATVGAEGASTLEQLEGAGKSLASWASSLARSVNLSGNPGVEAETTSGDIEARPSL